MSSFVHLGLHESNLCWVVDPLQRFVAGDHGQEVGEGAHGVVGASGRVLALFQDDLAHDDGVQVVDHTLEEHQGQSVRESLHVVALAVRAAGAVFRRRRWYLL